MENLSNKQYLEMLGKRIKLYRVYSGISQNELEEKTGISKRTISRLELGNSIQLDSFLKILSALELSENIQLLIPDQEKRPSAFLANSKIKQRVHRKSTNEAFAWGDNEE